MAAVQVLASANTTIYTPSGDLERVSVFNNGPNTIWVNTAQAASGDLRNTGFPIPAGSNGSFDPMRGALVARASTADQVSPADTRVVVIKTGSI